MNRPSDSPPPGDPLREKIIGLGARSIRKSYYPELQQRLGDLERFKALLNHSRDVILLADAATGRLLDANEALFRDLGYAPPNLDALALDMLFPPDTQQTIEQILTQEEQPPAGRTMLTEICTRWGEWIPAEITVNRVCTDQGRFVVIVARDDSERRRMEETIRLESRRKDEFLTMLAHELRNPLAPMVNATEILGRIGPQDPCFLRQQAILKRQLSHLTRLVGDLLDVSRITQGRIQLKLERLDLRRVLERTVECFSGLIRERGLTLSEVCASEPLWTLADPTRMEQIFGNLLHNAIKYTDKGGSILVATEVEPADGKAAASPRHCQVRIRDSGVGIAPENLQFIFGVFSQVDQTLDRSAGGLGLGLSLVLRLVQMHGGTVQVFSEGVGRGSEFVVTLPLADEIMAQAAV